MPRLFSFLFGMIVGALLCYGATNYHLIRAQDGFHVVHKVRAHLSEAYVDIRNFGVTDWTDHSELVAALAHDNKQYLMEGAAAQTIQETVNQFAPSWPQQ